MKISVIKSSAFVAALAFSMSLGLGQIIPAKAEALEISISPDNLYLSDNKVVMADPIIVAQHKKSDPPKVHKYGEKKNDRHDQKAPPKMDKKDGPKGQAGHDGKGPKPDDKGGKKQPNKNDRPQNDRDKNHDPQKDQPKRQTR